MFTQLSITAIIAIIYTSFFEWVLHKYIMHKPFFGFDYPFEAHAKVHHQTFKADHTYHLQNNNEEHRRTIPMAWWNALVLVPIASIPSIPISIMLNNWWISFTTAAVIACYYCTYEYLHYCMHLPKARRIEKSWLFKKLNGHHILHHRYMGKNFNVVLPLADLLTGTLKLRSDIAFPQVRGPSVPDLQPKPVKLD